MLVAAIDRNKASEPDKYVERVLSTPMSLPTLRSGEQSSFKQQFSKRKGIILTNGDRRNHDPLIGNAAPLQSSPQSPAKDRRHHKNLAPQSKWNSQTHEIIVIAVEKDPSASKKWTVGEEVVVAPSAVQDILPEPPVTEYKRTAPMANKEEMDYVVSLSRSLRKKI
jgi:hypothetical protein